MLSLIDPMYVCMYDGARQGMCGMVCTCMRERANRKEKKGKGREDRGVGLQVLLTYLHTYCC